MGWLHLMLADDSDPERLLADPVVNDLVGPRWQRALASGASPEGPPSEPILTERRLRERREAVGPMLSVLDGILSPVLRGFAKRDYTLLFADQSGVIVRQDGGGGFADDARRLRLQVGSCWDEPTRGTNAIGTALTEGRAIVVHGGAHLARPNRSLVCYAAPVHDSWGEVVGVLDATSFASAADPAIGAAIFAAARAMEEALHVASLARAGGGIVERLLGRLREPAFLVAPDGQITHANDAARASDRDLGSSWSAGSSGVGRVRVAVRRALGVEVTELAAAARGQIRLPGLEVEPVGIDGRIGAFLVLATPARAAVPPPPTVLERLVGSDPAIVAVRSHAATIARSMLPILVRGPSGTGKELVARGIHDASERADAPFVAVNCGAITPTLLHSELFGYGPGAFTGADTRGRDGLVAAADGGTLFLDEFADMPGPVQVLLLRFLEDGTYRRVGETRTRRADVRLICATARDLEQRVAEGTFRDDLYYRVCGVVLRLPPLSARSDLALLARTLLQQLADERGQGRAPFVSEAAMALLAAAPWPGNVRQLKMALHHALVMAGDARTLEPHHLPQIPRAPTGDPVSVSTVAPAVRPRLVDTQVEAIRRALAAADGNVSAAARSLGIARSTVYRILRRHPRS
jgi:transcriptional regulator of acetoin/glycerol metabolism